MGRNSCCPSDPAPLCQLEGGVGDLQGSVAGPPLAVVPSVCRRNFNMSQACNTPSLILPGDILLWHLRHCNQSPQVLSLQVFVRL